MSKRKRRFCDRSDGRKLKNIDTVIKVTPFIMRYRSDAQNMFSDSIDIRNAEKYIRSMHEKGYKHFGLIHVVLAAYIRTVSQIPEINRFVSGQQIYARNSIDIAMTIKKEMAVRAPETCLKFKFEPDATPVEIYEQMNKIIEEYRAQNEKSSFDGVAKILSSLPRCIFKFALFIIRILDYFGLVPKSLLDVSPFHASVVITSMGSLGIPPIFHHIYDLGNVPLFISIGKRRKAYELDAEGKVEEKIYSDICVVTDERICDGFTYASAFKMMMRYMRSPEKLDTKPEKIVEDVD